jgi:hypothetical protein
LRTLSRTCVKRLANGAGRRNARALEPGRAAVKLSTDPDAAMMTGKSDSAEWTGERFRKRRAAPEAAIQRAIIDRLRWHGVMAIHVPNAGKRSAIAGRRVKAEGLRPGFPDLVALQGGRCAFLEVKAPKGRLSPAQVECHAELERQGFGVAVVTSQDEAIAALRARGFVL